MHAFAEAAQLQTGDSTASEDKALAASDAFAEFATRHARFAFQVAYALLRNAGDAEDAVQECFLKLYRSGRWQAAQDQRAYLARSVWRAAGDLRTRDARLPRVELEPAGSPPAELASAAPGPERQAQAAEAHRAVHRLIEALPEKLRQPLVLLAIEEMSSAEVAVALRLPEGTVRRRAMQARTMLRQKLNAMEENRGR